MPVQVNANTGVVTTTGGSAAKVWTPAKPCTHGVVRVFDIGKTAIFAGSHRDYDYLDDNDWELRVRLADKDWELSNFGEGAPVKAYNGAELLFPQAVIEPVCVPTMDIVWGDYQVPSLTPAWWYDFVKTIMSWDTPKDIGISCMGGHGRTGTFLTILAQLSGQVPEVMCPITWVRNQYCDKAVESWAQALYIKRITGVETDYEEKKPTYSPQQRSWLDRVFPEPKVTKEEPAQAQGWDYVSEGGRMRTAARYEDELAFDPIG